MGAHCDCSRGCPRDTYETSDTMEPHYRYKSTRNSKSSSSSKSINTQRYTTTIHIDPKTMELLQTESIRSIPIAKAASPKTLSPIVSPNAMMKSVSASEKDVVADNVRLNVITNAPNLLELEHRISSVYETNTRAFTDDDTDEELSDDTDLSDIGELKWKRASSINTMRAYKQDDTKRKLNEREMNDLAHEMKQHLFDLTRHSTFNEMDELCKTNQLSQIYTPQTPIKLIDLPSEISERSDVDEEEEDDDDETEEIKASNLYREESEMRWTSLDIDQQKEEMSKQILYLASQSMTML